MRRSLVVSIVVAGLALAAAGPAAAEPAWAPATTAPVHPGVQTDTAGGQCTANFVFFDAANDVYIGQAAHCSGADGNTATNGCVAGTRPHGTPVTVDGATRPGTIVYSSWVAMQAAGESDANTCQYNDIALIKLDPADYGRVNPTIPFWGGPTGVRQRRRAATRCSRTATRRCGSASRSCRRRRARASARPAAAGRTRSTRSRPGVPGDSGSAFIDRQGRAGVLSTLQLAPLAGANGVSDVSPMISYMESHGGPDVTLALGTEAFRGPLLPSTPRGVPRGAPR